MKIKDNKEHDEAGTSSKKLAEKHGSSSLNSYVLIVYNDDCNTFDHVIETLIAVCDYSQEQAYQCALLIHYKGKYNVKHGNKKKLKFMRDAIVGAGIKATVTPMT